VYVLVLPGSTAATITNLSLNQVLGVIIFIWAWYKEHQSAVILADLRKDEKGQVVSMAHKIPQGGLFELISCPHMTCEILIYVAIYLILQNSTTFFYIVVWVASNQIQVALFNHSWYKKTFEAYPKHRKAIIPYVL